MAQRTPLLELVQKFFESDPVSAAHSLETMEEADAVKVLRALPPALSSRAFPHLHVSHAAALLKEVPPEIFRAIVDKLEPERGASIFVSLPDDVRMTFIDHLSENVKRKIQELLTFPENSAGRIMSSDYLAFHTEVKVKEAIQRIRNLSRTRPTASYAYVLDADHRLVGVMNMRDLMLAPGGATLESIMRTDVFTVNAFMDREEVANVLSERKYFAAPVVDNERRLLGVVKTEQLLEHVQEEATEDIQKMFGAGGDERAHRA